MIKQMTKERREAYVEVLEILKHMDKKYVSKIPIDLREFFERNASKEYEFSIDKTKLLEEHNLKNSTINILAMLNINYWCEDAEHKKELLKQYYENDLKKESELRNKYNTDNLFKRNTKVVVPNKEDIENFPTKYQDNKLYKKIYIGIVNCIKRILKKL